MLLHGVISGVTKKNIGIKTVFYIQLVAEDAIKLDKGSIECLYYGSRIELFKPIQVTGDFINERFVVTKMESYFTRPDQVTKYMVNKVKGSGLGKKRVETVVEQFGESIFTMTRDEFKEHLEEDFKSPISMKTITKFLDIWYAPNTLSKLEEFFGPYEIKYSTLEKIEAEYKKEAIEKFKTEPYKECIKFDIKRQVAENIAHDYKIDRFDARRISGLISYALLAAENEGHTYLVTTDLVNRVSKFSMNLPYKTRLPLFLIANEVTTNHKFHLDETNKYVSFTSVRNEEINISIRLNRINKELDSSIKIEESKILEIEKQMHIHFAPEQRESFKILEKGGINILTGGPGTGKTAIIKGIVSYYSMMNPGKPVLLCAPTGKAATKLEKSTGLEAKTIHKLLEFKPFQEKEAERNNNNPLDAGLIIVDEISMCDTHILNLLLNATPNDCRLIFVGDENQLPSVGAGNCLHDMIASNLFGVYRLVQNFRSEGSIIENANKVLNGQFPSSNFDFEIKHVETEHQAYNELFDLMKQYYNPSNPFYSQVIEPSKKGAAGCEAINHMAHKYVHQNLGDNISDDMMVGDKIMFIRNEYQTIIDGDDTKSEPLYTNGEQVTINALTDDEVTIFDGDKEKTLKRTVLNDAKLSYSYTIHKSQGSENEVIIIYLSGEDNVKCMMNRNLLYTAITRAKKKVVLVYSGNALDSCIKNEYFIKRNTRLLEFLQNAA